MAPPRPILNLDFTSGGRFDRRLSFTRPSRGFRLTPQGWLRAAPPGLPRLDSDPAAIQAGVQRGLLFEPAATNLLPAGAGLDWADWPPTSEGALTGFPAPDGSLTACRTADACTVSLHRLRLDSLSEEGPYTASLYVKPAGSPGLRLQLFGYDRGAYPLDQQALIDLQGGVLLAGSSPDATLAPAGNGWYRVSMTTGRVLDGTAVFLCFATPDPVNPPEGPGDGSCAVDVWGAQLEAGGAASSFIATADAAAARAAETCTLPLALVRDWMRGWTAAEGTLFIEGAGRAPTGAPQTLAALSDGTAANGFALRLAAGLAGDTALQARAVAGGVEAGTLAPGPVVPGTRWRAALAWWTDGVAACLDGGAVVTGAGPPPPGLNTLHLGGWNGAEPANAWIGRVALYRQRLPDAELRRVTLP